ncbi:RimJ/RimL family protein N-acetyltransferase [Mumia flava]|uniref:RimJ/RimL family protein N-acetyltransferase n=1 Tax=Mumia flava TaxID=1348852 RepID=A0A0B2BSX8_9ACTN|nr:GNAT family N-acetyltransferase [Mumia flava]PJJ57264.1 RimJ/RimL family protein N-acetyltransferase [Mumia flava]
MTRPVSLTTDRLVLRPWQETDRAPFAALNADGQVMEHFPAPLTRAESDALVDRIVQRFAAQGFGLWAVEESATGTFLGFTGLNPVPEAVAAAAVRDTGAGVGGEDDPTPTEIGWRLARHAWGRGLASEAARAAARYAFDRAGLSTVWSFTSVTNDRSVAVMRRIGMVLAGEFDNPRVPAGSRLVRHVLYRLDAVDGPRDASTSTTGSLG